MADAMIRNLFSFLVILIVPAPTQAQVIFSDGVNVATATTTGVVTATDSLNIHKNAGDYNNPLATIGSGNDSKVHIMTKNSGVMALTKYKPQCLYDTALNGAGGSETSGCSNPPSTAYVPCGGMPDAIHVSASKSGICLRGWTWYATANPAHCGADSDTDWGNGIAGKVRCDGTTLSATIAANGVPGMASAPNPTGNGHPTNLNTASLPYPNWWLGFFPGDTNGSSVLFGDTITYTKICNELGFKNYSGSANAYNYSHQCAGDQILKWNPGTGKWSNTPQCGNQGTSAMGCDTPLP